MITNNERSVLITGAGGGLGSALLKRYIGAEIPVVAITGKASLRIPLCHSDSRKITIYSCDLMSDESTNSTIFKLKNHDFQAVFFCHGGPIISSNDPSKIYSELRAVLRLNFESIVQLIEGLIEQLIISKATICAVSSISGMESQGNPAYSAAKSALIAYTRSLGRYVSKNETSMFCVSPGAFHVEGGYWTNIKKLDKQKYDDFVDNRMSAGRIADVDEVANFIFSLACAATPYIAGNNFVFDGGQGRGF
jgi:NAD(P)-dependent dehydrogenase (short-subunit alcohol dehydrogenase family)